VPVYTNLDGTTPDKGLADILKWQVVDRLAGRRRADPGGFVTPRRDNDGRALEDARAHLTWVGHATFAMRLGGRMVLTDPVWAERMATRKRLSAPGVAVGALPPVDVVTVSHAHFDHMDLPTLRAIGPRPTYVVPKDNADLLRGLPNVVELGWWESWETKDLRVTLVPAHHWSMRAPWDRNQRLWGGFVYESPEGAAYHAGDTAMSPLVFDAIADRFPRLDWAMLPIGAYDPPWFMSPQHMGPEEAVRAWERLGARHLVAMHWGTYRLTDEPTGEPPQRLRKELAACGHDAARAWVMDVGETRALAR